MAASAEASADRCTSSTSSTASSARPALSAATCRSRSGAPSPAGSADGATSRSCSSATARRRAASSSSRSTWRRCGRFPVILVCENNGFAEFTPRSAHSTVERVADVVAPYGLERATVDGNDVAAVRRAFAGFLAAARRGDGPVPARVPDPPRCAATTRATRSATARRSPQQEWQRLDPIRGSSGAGSTRGGSTTTRPLESSTRLARRSRRRSGSRARARSRRPRLTVELVYATVTETTTTLEAIRTTLAEAMRADERVLVLGEDVAEGGPWGATAGLADEFGAGRVRNTPISEAAICGVAIGAAQSGMRPVVEIMFVDFVTLALDQLVNQAAKAHFMSGGQLVRAARPPHPGRRAASAAARSTRRASRLAGARARAQGGDAEHRGRRGGAPPRARSPTRTRSSSSRTRRSTSAARSCRTSRGRFRSDAHGSPGPARRDRRRALADSCPSRSPPPRSSPARASRWR